MKVKFLFKIILSGDFKDIFVKKKSNYDKKYHRKLLQQSVIDLFSKFKQLDVLDFTYGKISKTTGVVVYLTNVLDVEEPDLKKLELDVKHYSISPHYLKHVKILKTEDIL